MNIKLIVAIAVFAIVAASVFAFVRQRTAADAARAGRRTNPFGRSGGDGLDRSTQDALPVADIRGPVLLQRDGTAICYVKVSCKNNSLLNLKELTAEAAALAPCLASQTSALKIIHIQRPVDSSANLARLEACDEAYKRQLEGYALESGGSRRERMARAQTEARRAVLGNYHRHALLEVKQTKRMRSEAYIVLPVPYGVGNEATAYQKACDMRDRLKASGYTSHVLWDQEIVSLCLSYQGAHRTASENLDPNSVSPLVRGLNDTAYTGFEREGGDNAFAEAEAVE